MGDKTAIPYADATWNPMLGCTRLSAGCKYCYAERLASTRLAKMPAYAGLASAGSWTGTVRLLPERLDQPIRWRRPRVIFANDMGDVFHPLVPFEYIASILYVVAAAPQHTFLFLTKRVERAAEFFRWIASAKDPLLRAERCAAELGYNLCDPSSAVVREYGLFRDRQWPLPNLWLGATVESPLYSHRIIQLAGITEVSNLWLSLEPLLGRVELNLSGIIPTPFPGYMPLYERIGCVVMGGESGPNARACELENIRAAVDECSKWGVTPFVKQLGAKPVLHRPGDAAFARGKPGAIWPGGRSFAQAAAADPTEWPEDLRRFRTAPWMKDAAA